MLLPKSEPQRAAGTGTAGRSRRGQDRWERCPARPSVPSSVCSLRFLSFFSLFFSFRPPLFPLMTDWHTVQMLARVVDVLNTGCWGGRSKGKHKRTRKAKVRHWIHMGMRMGLRLSINEIRYNSISKEHNCASLDMQLFSLEGK